MKAPIAQAAAEAASPPGCAFFCSGVSKSQKHFKKLGFRLGEDFAVLSSAWHDL
jgi:hypothetical protein